MEVNREPTDALVIGIDFGTTFSGVAATYGDKPEAPDDINVIKTWPGGHGITSDKVPTEISYGSASVVKKDDQNPYSKLQHGGASLSDADPFNFRSMGDSLPAAGATSSSSGTNAKPFQWGFEIRPDQQRIRCMKLLLDPRQPLPGYVSLQDIKAQLSASKKDVHAVATNFLSALYKHAKTVLVKRYGEHFMATTNLVIVLTVPAVWSDAAKNATLKAAMAAGIGAKITMISEPEAAAVYTLQAIQPNHLKAGDNFVIIDAGGGTVDLISYQIKQSKPLRVEESVPGSGACCGAALLNLRFEEHIRTKLGDSVFDHIHANKPRAWTTALKYFEDYVKRNFDPEEDNTFNVPFPGVPDDENAGIECGFLVLTSDEVGNLFRPIIAEIIKLVDGQIANLKAANKSVNGLILVGGFGQSECLLKCLKNRFARSGGTQESPEKLEVLQPVNAWTAVVRGAVLRGLEGTELVTTRKARRHYGVRYLPVFDPSVHPYSCRDWDEYNECWRADDRMKWYITKGQSVSSTEPIRFPFKKDIPLPGRRNVNHVLELIACDEDQAPDGYQSDITTTVCTTTVRLQKVPAHLWTESSNSKGHRFRSLSLEMGMQVESGGLRFDLRVDGVVYGEATTKFE